MPASEVEEVKKTAKKPAAAPVFEVAVNRDALLDELSIASNVVEARTVVQVLTNVLFTAVETGVLIHATDLDRSLRTHVPAKVKNTGSVAIPSRKLYDYVKLLPRGSEITIREMENHWVQIRSGRSVTKMIAMSSSNFPSLPQSGTAAIKLPVRAMRMLIAQTAYAISKTESRYTLNGALLSVHPDKLVMVATDGHRLALSERHETIEGVKDPFNVIVPDKALQDLDAMMSVTEEDCVSFAHDDRVLYFTLGYRQYTCKRLVGEFPNYAAVIPPSNNNHCIMSVSDLEQSIKRVSTFSDEKSGAVKMSISDNTLTVSAACVGSGESEETIETAYTAPSVVIGFNASYLLEFLKTLDSKGTTRINLKDGSSACLIEPFGENLETRQICVLMPMRI
jgi:DNA polymerase-3 subunit beta